MNGPLLSRELLQEALERLAREQQPTAWIAPPRATGHRGQAVLWFATLPSSSSRHGWRRRRILVQFGLTPATRSASRCRSARTPSWVPQRRHETISTVASDSSRAVLGPALAIVGAVTLLCSTLPSWFSVLVKYPTDQILHDYGIFAFDRGSLHSYSAYGWSFEVLTLIAGIVALVAAGYAGGTANRAGPAAVTVTACGAIALAVVAVASLTFEIANPRSDDLVLGSDLRLGPGAIAAAVAGVVIVAGGLLTRRALVGYR